MFDFVFLFQQFNPLSQNLRNVTYMYSVNVFCELINKLIEIFQ